MPGGQFERDPLSVRYDGQAGRLLGRAIAAEGRWVSVLVRRPEPGPRAVQWLREHGITLGLVDAGGLANYERAFQRSLYYVHNGGGNGRRNAVWSLQREWDGFEPGGRVIWVRVLRPKAAHAAARRMPAADAWWKNPELRSGGLGSGRERFPA